jgi:hypothetical protein
MITDLVIKKSIPAPQSKALLAKLKGTQSKYSLLLWNMELHYHAQKSLPMDPNK